MPAPKSSALEDDEKYRMVNAMIKQMGFKSEPVVIPKDELEGLSTQIKGLNATFDVMQGIGGRSMRLLDNMLPN